MDDTLNIVKGGESVIRISLVRSAKGLLVNVKAHPAVEEFFRANAVHVGQTTPTTLQTNAIGRHWLPGKKADGEAGLAAYDRVVALPVLLGGDSVDIANVDRLGQPLLEPHAHGSGRRSHSINLSLLRLVGVSDPEGVTFYVRGVHSIDLVREMKVKLGEGVKAFYASYLKPVQMSVVCLTQEVSLPGIEEMTR